MKMKWKQLLTTSLILSCLTSGALFETQALAEETISTSSMESIVSSTETESTENTESMTTDQGTLNTTPIELANEFAAGVTPNQLFIGKVGDHPLLESFGDTEGEGLLAGVTRDTGLHKVIPIKSVTTPNRQMAMKLGNERFNTRRNYPNDEQQVSELVYEKTLNDYGNMMQWGGTFLDTASVGLLSADGKSFLDVNSSAIDPKNVEKQEAPTTRSDKTEKIRAKGMLIGQTADPEATTYGMSNSRHYHWSVETPNGLASGNSPKDGVALMKMYNTTDGVDPYVVAYGAHVQKTRRSNGSGDVWVGPFDLLGYVRVIMQPVDEEGRVRITYSYINLTTVEEREHSAFYYNFGNGLNETKSKGDDIGEYFSTPRASIDNTGFAYAMYRDTYPEKARDGQPEISSPTGRVVRNGIPNKLFDPGINPADPGKNQLFAERYVGYVGEKQATPFGEMASWDVDVQGFNMHTLTVKHLYRDTGKNFALPEISSWLYGDEYTTEPKTHKTYRAEKPYPENANGTFGGSNVEVIYYYELKPTHGNVITHHVDTEGNQISPKETYRGAIGAKYSTQPKTITNYIYAKTEDREEMEVNLTVEEDDQHVTFVYIKENEIFKLTQAVTNDAAESMDQGSAKQGESLNYSLDLSVAKEIQERPYVYQSAVLTLDISPDLENITEIELKDSADNLVGSGTYNEGTNKLIVRLTADNLLTTDNLSLSYKATVKMTAKIADDIKQLGTADVAIKFKEITTKVIKVTSNEVVTAIESGQLELVSAPLEVDFGEVKVIDFQKKVGTDKSNVSQPLSVIDKRVTPQKWDIVAKVIKHMTNGDHELTSALKYRYNGKTLTLGSDIKTIYESEGTTAGHEVNITDTWGTEALEDGLKLKVPAEQVPKTTGNYEGTIKWTLRETIE